MIRHRAVIVAFLLLLVSAPSSRAAVPEEIARDFATLSGYVVMPADGEFLIDRGAADGIAIGDLFSVVRPGKQIVHPVTGKALGTLDQVKGFLQVTRVRPGYSHARPLDVRETIEKGDVIRRYDLVPAAFLDATGSGRPVYDRIRTALPRLEWGIVSADADGKAPLPEGTMLVFVLEDGRLEVRGPDHRILHSYNMAGGKVAGALPAAGPRESTGESPAGRGMLSGGGRGPVGKTLSAVLAVRGELPAGTIMADFVRDGDRLLVAVTDGDRIDVFAVGDDLVRLGGGQPPRSGSVYSLHWWRPRPDVAPLLAATVAVDENKPYSPTTGKTVIGVVFTLADGRLTQIPDELPYLLGSFDRDGDGIPETLLGQAFDRDIFFGDRVREIRLKEGRLAIDEPSFPIPSPFSVQGTLFADLTGDGRPESVSVRNRALFIYQGTKLLYESSRQMGGSLSVLMYDLNPDAKDRLFTSAGFEVPPVAVDLDGDGRVEVVTIASEGSGAFGLGSGVRKSWLATLAYHDGRFVRGTLGPELETPLQGLYTDRNGVYVVSTHSPSSLTRQKGESLLLFLPFSPPPRD
jgi:hypothetical protein